MLSHYRNLEPRETYSFLDRFESLSFDAFLSLSFRNLLRRSIESLEKKATRSITSTGMRFESELFIVKNGNNLAEHARNFPTNLLH